MADTWTSKKKKSEAPLGATPSAIDQSFFNAIKDLTVEAPEVAQELYNKGIELGNQKLQNTFTPKGAFQTGAGLLFGGNNPVTSAITSNIAGGVYDVGAPIVSGAYQAMVENSDEYQQKQAVDAMRKAGVNPLAAEYASVGDYGVSDLPGSYESQMKQAINESLARAASESSKAEATKQSKVDQALAEALSNEIGDYGVNDPSASITKNSGWDSLSDSIKDIIDQQELSKQAGAIPGDYSPASSNVSKSNVPPVDNTAIPNPLAGVPTTVPMTVDLSSVFNAASYNDKDGGNDSGQQAPAGGYTSYSGEDVEASYSVPDSKPAGQSSGNWNTTARQVSTAPSDSGGSSGGK